MKPTEKIGIVIPSYNQGTYIEETIKSVVENKKNADIKLVIIDGGSTDNTSAIVQQYQDHIFKWISEKDTGQAQAINKGMAYLNDCTYVTWINSDDVYEHDKAVLRMLQFISKKQADICYGKSFYIDQNGVKIGEYSTKPFDRQLFPYLPFISQPSTLIRKSAWDTVSGVNESLFMCLDYELWIKLSAKHSFVYLEEHIANTRLYPETKTSKHQSISINEAIAILNKYYQKVPHHWIASKILETYPRRSIVTKCLAHIKALACKQVYIKDAVTIAKQSGYYKN